MNECCGNCKYHQYEDISQGWVCCNQDSEYVADWTDYTDSCEEWESRDEMQNYYYVYQGVPYDFVNNDAILGK